MRVFWAVLAVIVVAGCQFKGKDIPENSFEKHFSPLIYGPEDTLPAQFKGTEWDPALWPLSYQNKDNFTRGLFKADIIRDQYIKDETIPILVVGPNFYHLSDQDQIRLCDTINQLYGATSGSYGAYLLIDWYSRKVIGEYSKSGLVMR